MKTKPKSINKTAIKPIKQFKSKLPQTFYLSLYISINHEHIILLSLFFFYLFLHDFKKAYPNKITNYYERILSLSFHINRSTFFVYVYTYASCCSSKIYKNVMCSVCILYNIHPSIRMLSTL